MFLSIRLYACDGGVDRMKAKEIIDRCAQLEVYQRRRITDEYAELVFYNKDLAQWDTIMTDILGPTVCPAGTEPTPEDTQLTSDYGGITSQQTLYRKDFHDHRVIVMLWPWNDQAHTTLKIIVLKKQA